MGVGENVFIYAFLRGSMLYILDPLRVPGCLFWCPFFLPCFGFCYLAPCLTACRNGGRVDDEGRAGVTIDRHKKGDLSFIPTFGGLYGDLVFLGGPSVVGFSSLGPFSLLPL